MDWIKRNLYFLIGSLMALALIDSRPWYRGSTRASAELTERPFATTLSTTEREIASASSSRPVFRFRATRTERRPVTGYTFSRVMPPKRWAATHLVRDFLEIKCTLKDSEQEFLLDFLRGKGVKAEAIQMHPAFSVDDHLVVILEDADSKKRLFYHPGKKTIEK